MTAESRDRFLLRDDRQNGADDQRPIRIEVYRHDRLDIEHEAPAVFRPIATIVVELERDADETGDRIGELFRELRIATLARGRRGERGRCDGDSRRSQ